MITHVVLLQTKPEVTSEEIATALEHVRALQQEIPGIVDVQVGKNMSNIIRDILTALSCALLIPNT